MKVHCIQQILLLQYGRFTRGEGAKSSSPSLPQDLIECRSTKPRDLWQLLSSAAPA